MMTLTYISLFRKGRRFAIVQVTAGHMDVGIKLKGRQPTGRFQAAGVWS
jgi:hypothetical protein